MSAIFGFVRRGPHPDGIADLARMDRALTGPYDRSAGYLVRDGAGLGCRRWTRQHSSDGPWTISDDAIAFVATGRIDNRQEILSLLRETGAPLKDNSDVGLLFAAYRQLGISGLRRIAGVYALAAWHEDKQRLLLARSAVVAPPLHYHSEDGSLTFSTMPRGLFALPGIARRLDRRTLAMNLIRLSGPDPVTLYQDISRLPTGSTLVWEGGKPVVEQWWKLDFDHPCPGSLQEHARGLHELMSQVVREQTPKTGPVAMLLSGGLDSAAIAALAATQRPGQPLMSFTHVPATAAIDEAPDGWCLDETPTVKDIAAAHPGIDSRILPHETEYFLDGSDSIMALLERHISNIANFGWIQTALREAKHEGAEIMLTGMQGNLAASRSGGSPLPTALASGQWRAVSRAFSLRAAVSASLMQLPTALWRRQLAFRGHPIATKERPWREYSAIHPNFADAQEIDDLGGEWLETYLPRTRVDERNALLHTLMRQDVGLVDHNLNVLHGVELRNPLADIRIIAYCLSIPNHLFHSWDLPRPLIRIAMRGLLPDSVLLNCTRGVQGADIYRRLRAHRSRILEDLDRLNESELAREVLDLSRIRAVTEQWLNQGGGVATPIINPLLVFGLSMGRFLIWLEREGIH